MSSTYISHVPVCISNIYDIFKFYDLKPQHTMTPTVGYYPSWGLINDVVSGHNELL